jgi:hypothetical protein
MEDTVSFQQTFFAGRIFDGKIDANSCRDWYDGTRRRPSPWLSSNTTHESLPYANLIDGIITAVFADAGTEKLPRSFQFDQKRIERASSDMMDLVHLEIGLLVFDELCFWLTSGQPGSISSKTNSELPARILALVDEQHEVGDPWQISISDVALELTRAACTACGYADYLIPDCLIHGTFLRLKRLFAGQDPECAVIWETFKVELGGRVMQHAQVFNNMTVLAMSEAQRNWQKQREQEQALRQSSLRPLPEVEDIARRIAHVGIIHWKIWAQLVYLDDGEQAATEEGTAMVKAQPDPTMVRDAVEISSLSSSVDMMTG